MGPGPRRPNEPENDISGEQILSVVLPAAGLAAMQRGNDHCYIESCFLYSKSESNRDPQGYIMITCPPCPAGPSSRVARAQGAYYPARGEPRIFKLSLQAASKS